VAILSRIIGIAPCAPGFLGVVAEISVPVIWIHMYSYAWFISFFLSGVSYFLMMQLVGKEESNC